MDELLTWLRRRREEARRAEAEAAEIVAAEDWRGADGFRAIWRKEGKRPALIARPLTDSPNV